MGSKLLSCCSARRNSDDENIKDKSEDTKSAPAYNSILTNYSSNPSCDNTQTRQTIFSNSFSQNTGHFCGKCSNLPFSKTMKNFGRKKYSRDFDEEFMWDFNDATGPTQAAKTGKNFNLVSFSKHNKIFRQNDEIFYSPTNKIHINKDINKHFRTNKRFNDDIE